jgi:serine/threonine protein kinase
MCSLMSCMACMQVATALDYLHRHPLAICNRDVKLENMLVFGYDAQHCDGKPRPCIKLADFGFCKSHSSTSFNLQERTRLGTSYYVAPEVFGLIPCASFFLSPYALGMFSPLLCTTVPGSACNSRYEADCMLVQSREGWICRLKGRRLERWHFSLLVGNG